MTTNKVDLPTPAGSPPAAAPKTSPLRLVLLLALLAAAIGAYAYDFGVAKPGSAEAYKKIQELVDTRNRMGVKEGGVVAPADIHKEVGMQPTWVDSHPDEQYAVEYYCWWGPLPGFNMRRHFISIVYNGVDPNLKFSSHYHNERPPREALPIPDDAPAVMDDEPLPPLETPGAKRRDSETPTAKDPEDPSAKEPSPPSDEKKSDNTSSV